MTGERCDLCGDRAVMLCEGPAPDHRTWHACDRPEHQAGAERQSRLTVAIPTPRRYCHGSPHQGETDPHHCGAPATVVCSDREGLSWFACERADHRQGALAFETVGTFFESLGKS